MPCKCKCLVLLIPMKSYKSAETKAIMQHFLSGFISLLQSFAFILLHTPIMIQITVYAVTQADTHRIYLYLYDKNCYFYFQVCFSGDSIHESIIDLYFFIVAVYAFNASASWLS